MQVEAHREASLMFVRNVQKSWITTQVVDSGNKECVQLLLTNGANIDAKAFVSTETLK